MGEAVHLRPDLTDKVMLLRGRILTSKQWQSNTSHSLLVFLDGPLDASQCETLTQRGSLSPGN
jgi:hypothetical protein